MIVVRSVKDAVEALELTNAQLRIGRLPLPLRLVGTEDGRMSCVVGPEISLFAESGRTGLLELVFVRKTAPREGLAGEQCRGVHVLLLLG